LWSPHQLFCQTFRFGLLIAQEQEGAQFSHDPLPKAVRNSSPQTVDHGIRHGQPALPKIPTPPSSPSPSPRSPPDRRRSRTSRCARIHAAL
jgi:hypothetical protein